MRRLLLALAFLLLPLAAGAQGPIVGPGNVILCPNPAPFTGTGALSQVVAAKAGQSIFICGWHITSSVSAGTFSFSYGTGTNCGTGTTTILPASNVSNNAPATDHIDYAFIQIPAGNALCQNSTLTTTTGALWTNQF